MGGAYSYFSGCDGAGADCTSGSCSTAFHVPTDTGVQVACQSNNVRRGLVICREDGYMLTFFRLQVNLAITFCD